MGSCCIILEHPPRCLLGLRFQISPLLFLLVQLWSSQGPALQSGLLQATWCTTDTVEALLDDVYTDGWCDRFLSLGRNTAAMLRKIRPLQHTGAMHVMPDSIFLIKNMVTQIDGTEKVGTHSQCVPDKL